MAGLKFLIEVKCKFGRNCFGTQHVPWYTIINAAACLQIRFFAARIQLRLLVNQFVFKEWCVYIDAFCTEKAQNVESQCFSVFPLPPHIPYVPYACALVMAPKRISLSNCHCLLFLKCKVFHTGTQKQGLCQGTMLAHRIGAAGERKSHCDGNYLLAARFGRANVPGRKG
jgi:hypothetical protein